MKKLVIHGMQDMTEHPSCAHKNQLHSLALVMLVLLIVLGSIERVYGIDRQSLWSDELFAVMASYKSSFIDVWRLMLTDSHPPGYVSFMYGMLPLTGYSDFGIRLHALVFGILWIPLVFWLGKRWFSVSAGLLAAAIIASAYTAVYYSQEARAYTMLIVFNLINIICLFEILFTEKKLRRYVIGFIFSTLMMLYLHYTGFVFFAAEVLLYGIFWVTRQRCGSIRETLIIFGTPLLLYSPWLGVMYANMVDAPRDWSVSKAPTLTEVYNTMQRLLGPDDAHMEFHVGAIVIVIFCALSEHIKRGISQKILVTYSLLFLMIVPILAFYIQSWVATPIFEKRYFLSALVIDALLIAGVASQLIGIVAKKWNGTVVFAVILFFSAWTINSNVAVKLYASEEKDPIREAVNLIKEDIAKNASNKDYTVLMTHEWFEHYLKRSRISFDSKWPYRSFYVPQQIANIDEYLTKNKNIEYFYYLSLRQPNSEAAIFALKQQYKLLATAAVSVGTGTIDAFKFSTKDLPNDVQADNAGSNPSNEIAKLLAQDINQKNPATYRVLMTHKWMLPYLRRNNVSVDESWEAGDYVINAQAEQIFNYIDNHPEINTLYYLALQEPNAEGAAFMLQSRYLLADEKSVQISVGKMNILKFYVKEKSVVTDSLLERMRASQANQAAQWIFNDVGQSKPETYAVAMANGWMEPYLKLNGIAVDDAWPDRHYYDALKAQEIFEYLDKRAAINTFYYIALRESTAERAAILLQSRYQLVKQTAVDVAAGKIDVYKFDSKSKPLDVEAIKQKSIGDPLSDIAELAAKDVEKTGKGRSAFVMTHGWFQPYLRLHGVDVDEAWPDRFLINPNQLGELSKYLQIHPEIEHVYYLGLAEPNLQPVLDEMKNQMAVGCKLFINAPVGMLKLIRFDVKAPASSSAGGVSPAACGA